MSIKDYINKLKKADKAYINEQILRIIQNDGNYILDLNSSQLLSGIDSRGKQLKDYQNKQYAIFKNQLNPLPGFGTPDLYRTGMFQQGMYLVFSSGSGWPISIFSNDSKTKQLVDKYGKGIFGLTEENKGNAREHFKPKIRELFTSIFKL